MGLMVYSLLWAMQDVYHQPYVVWRDLRGAWEAELVTRDLERPRTEIRALGV